MRVIFVNELPQWIISSDVAAYHPGSKTIWMCNYLGWRVIPIFLHEICHWFIHIYLRNSNRLHNKLDGKI